MKKILGLFCLIFIFSTSSPHASERAVTLQLSWLHQFQFAGYYAAIEQGFYKDAGFNVTLKEGKPDLNPIDEVKNGHAQYGVSRSELVVQRMLGAPVTVLASIFQHSAIIFLSKKESGISSPQDMIGRRVMLLDGINAAEYLAVLHKEDLPEDKIIRQASSYDIDDLVDNKTDVFNAYSTNEPFYLKEKNVPYTIIQPRDYGIDFYGDVLFTSKQELADYPQDVKAFLKASLQGWQYALDHPEELIELLLSKYGVKKSREHLQFEAEAIRKLIMPELVEIGYMNPNRWQHIADIFVQLNMAPSSYSLNDFIYNPNPQAAQAADLSIFTEEEQRYLKEKKVITMSNNPNWEPIVFAQDGDQNNMQGIAIDTLKEIEKRIGIKFKNIPNTSWKEGQQFLKDKKVDVLPCYIKSPAREKYALFTRPYLHLPLAIFAAKDKSIVSGLDEVMDKSWTRQKSSGLIKKIQKEYPDTKIIKTSGDRESFQYVNSGKAYFTIATLPVASHVISKFMFNDLQIIGYTDFIYYLHIAVNDDYPILHSILNKALADIPEKRSKEIFRKWVSSSVKEPVTDYKLLGQVLLILSIVGVFFAYRQYILNRNITKLKAAEKQIKEEKERYKLVANNTSELIYEVDLKTNEVNWIGDVAALLGYDISNKEEWLKALHPEDRDGVIQELEKTLNSETERFSIQYRIKHQDGSWRIWLDQGSYISDETGEPLLWVSACSDITERTISENARLLLATAIEQASEIVMITDIEGTVQYVNPIFEQITGYNRKEAIGQNPRFLSSGSQNQGFYKKMWTSLLQGKVWSGLIINKKKDGSLYEEENTISPVTNSEGQIVNFVAVKRDVSKEVRLEKQLQRSEKMEAIGLMAGGVAHDLNNILSGIVSYPELMLLELPEDSPLRKPIETIQSSGLRAADVVADLLTVARGSVAVKEVCDLNKILREYMESPELKNPLETQPEITLHTDFAPDLFSINCSAIHIRKCVLNLFINACEAIDKVGTVTISTKNLYVDKPLKGYDEVRVGEYVVLSVMDTGSGISAEDLKHIFEPFYSKKVMGRSGTGLGLAVVWNAVQDHNSYIDVITSDQGTSFNLYFPASRELADDRKNQLTLPNLQGKGQTILIIDDENTQRDIATSLLTHLGYCPTSVCSGEEAIFYLKTHTVDLLILDMIMGPGMNGRETYEQIIALYPGQKAIIASGFSETDEVKKAQKLGAGVYLKKPYTVDQLGYAVKQELEI